MLRMTIGLVVLLLRIRSLWRVGTSRIWRWSLLIRAALLILFKSYSTALGRRAGIVWRRCIWVTHYFSLPCGKNYILFVFINVWKVQLLVALSNLRACVVIDCFESFPVEIIEYKINNQWICELCHMKQTAKHRHSKHRLGKHTLLVFKYFEVMQNLEIRCTILRLR